MTYQELGSGEAIKRRLGKGPVSGLIILVIDGLWGAAMTVWLIPSVSLSPCGAWSQDSISKEAATIYGPLAFESSDEISLMSL